MLLKIVPLYASLLVCLYLVLAFRTIRLRRIFRAAVGDQGQMTLARAVRAHGNFAEYVPLALLLLAFLELNGASGLLLHGLGVLLLAGRLFHSRAVSQPDEPIRLRVLGMALTFTVLISAAVGNVLLVAGS
ncbi:MAPEG family protein [Kiloniella sp. b19]|uniref:MAPEG family protein n=1 Tax=Kiloniella sp. GXU_MW_B19 TaxID=3141326 RepID=UPI0031DA2151